MIARLAKIDPEPVRETVEPLALTVNQVGRLLGISGRTVWRLVAKGELAPPVAIGSSARFKRGDVEAFLDGLPYRKENLRPKPGRQPAEKKAVPARASQKQHSRTSS
jgi:excisionase family DNA binding protein